jgi:hypothetical protein
MTGLTFAVIASEAKQSSFGIRKGWIASELTLLAETKTGAA